MLIAHRFELNRQAMRSFGDICGEEVALEQADQMADRFGNRHRIVVASVQSLNSQRKGRMRLENFDPSEFGLLLIDEAHRAAAPTYRRVINYFLNGNPDLRAVGVTATPDRLDGVGMGCVFQGVVGNYDILWGIKNGYLVEPVQKFVRIDGMDFSQCRTKGGDMAEADVARVVEAESVLHEMAHPIVQQAGRDKQAIVFTASVNQARRLAELIRDYYDREFGGVQSDTAVSIDGSLTPQDPRRQAIVADFKAGRIQFLVNCGVATEGFDAPSVRLIAIGRPTKSRALYTQMVGRGTRPIPGTVDADDMKVEDRIAAIAASVKPNCTVLDFVGQAGRHKLVCTADILGGDMPEEIVDEAKEIQKRGDWTGTSLEALILAQQEAEARREQRRKKVTTAVRYELESVDTAYDLSIVPKQCSMANFHSGFPVTPQQDRMLLKLGYSDTQIATMNKRTASAAIDYAIKNPINKFGRFLKEKKAQEDEWRAKQK
jgi:superfamily II DNA or RNA helicase